MQYTEIFGIIQRTAEAAAFDLLDLVVGSPVRSCAILAIAAICGIVARSFLLSFAALVLGILHIALFLPEGTIFERVPLAYAAAFGLTMLFGASLAVAWSRRRAQADIITCRSELRRVQGLLDQEITWRRAAETVTER